MIFSSIPVSDDDLLTDSPQTHRPFMDHLGIDVRDESDVSRKLFDAVPDTAADLGWRHVPQSGGTLSGHRPRPRCADAQRAAGARRNLIAVLIRSTR